MACLASLTAAFDGLRAAVAEKEAVQPGRDQRQQFLNQLQHGLVVDDVGLAVDQARGLLLDGGDHARVAVAGVGHPDPAGKIEVAPAGDIENFAAFRVVNQDFGAVGPDRGEVV